MQMIKQEYSFLNTFKYIISHTGLFNKTRLDRGFVLSRATCIPETICSLCVYVQVCVCVSICEIHTCLISVSM